MARFVSIAILCLVALVATSPPKAQAELTCAQVVRNLTPCISYVLYGGFAVPAECCKGVRTLYGMAKTTSDRRTVCSCIKAAVSSSGFKYSNYNLNLAAGIPGNCGVNIPYQINPKTDCHSVH